MGDILWIYAAIILSVSETWSLLPGTNQSLFDNSSTTPHPIFDVVKNLTFTQGTDVNLTCSDNMWNGTIYVIWKIHKYKYCEIGFSNTGNRTDSCHDGKLLDNTPSSQPYLHIPNFTTSDSGVYKCEWVYSGGIENYKINVAIRVVPIVSAWLEQKDNKLMAVCKAERGKPAANISWSYTGNQPHVEILDRTDGFFTVISHLEIPEGMDTKNLSCTVKNHYWQHQEVLESKPIKDNSRWLYIPIFVVIVFLAGFLFFAQKKLVLLRRCRQSTSSSSKSTEDVEDVEPYASYVQRVNSIYNSSADFCSLKNPAHASHAHA